VMALKTFFLVDFIKILCLIVAMVILMTFYDRRNGQDIRQIAPFTIVI